MCDQIVGAGEKIQRMLELVRTVAPSDSTVLIQGESGTGKELIARAIHEISPRQECPLVEDIPLLVAHFLRKCSQHAGKTVNSVSPEALERLCQYPWPGNVRELENAIERAVVVSRTDRLPLGALPEEMLEWSSGSAPVRPLEEYTFEEMERFMIQKALERAGGNKSRAARLLNIHRRCIYNRLKKYGLDC